MLRSIDESVSQTRLDLHALSRTEGDFAVIELDGRSSGKNEKELMRFPVSASYLGSTSRNMLEDDAKPGRVDQSPTVTDATPFVMFRR